MGFFDKSVRKLKDSHLFADVTEAVQMTWAEVRDEAVYLRQQAQFHWSDLTTSIEEIVKPSQPNPAYFEDLDRDERTFVHKKTNVGFSSQPDSILAVDTPEKQAALEALIQKKEREFAASTKTASMPSGETMRVNSDARQKALAKRIAAFERARGLDKVPASEVFIPIREPDAADLAAILVMKVSEKVARDVMVAGQLLKDSCERVEKLENAIYRLLSSSRE